MKRGWKIQQVGLQELAGRAHSQGALKILAEGFSTVEGYLRVTWDELHATNPQIQMGFFEALQKLWY